MSDLLAGRQEVNTICKACDVGMFDINQVSVKETLQRKNSTVVRTTEIPSTESIHHLFPF